jgi:hypothetical protein
MSHKTPAGEQHPVYIYIAARGHSGSTLLTLLLARHPRVVAVGELANLPLQLARDETTKWVGECSCGERPLACPMWGEVLGRIQADEGIDLDADPFSWRISDIGMEEEYRSSAPLRSPFIWVRNRFWRAVRYAQYYAPRFLRPLLGLYKPQKSWGENRSRLATEVARENGVDAIVDASKDPLDMLDVYENATMPVKVIHLTRDARGNIFSMIKKLGPDDPREGPVTRASHEWVKVNRRIWQLARQVPSADCLHVRYEDICRDPEGTMQRLFEFVGLEPHDVVNSQDDASGESDQGHTIGGNKIRFTSEKLHIREDFRWRENLTEKDLAIVRRIARPLSDTLGHEIEG